jgi:hypothetical protein
MKNDWYFIDLFINATLVVGILAVAAMITIFTWGAL